jgi:prefoldin subunit 5
MDQSMDHGSMWKEFGNHVVLGLVSIGLGWLAARLQTNRQIEAAIQPLKERVSKFEAKFEGLNSSIIRLEAWAVEMKESMHEIKALLRK